MTRLSRALTFLILMALLLALPAGPGAASPNAPAWECWDDGSLDPCHRGVNAIAMLSASDGWAVGSGGLILRWDGMQWKPVSSPVAVDLKAVAVLSSSSAWAVGQSGTVIHWDGASWGTVGGAGSSTLSSIAVVSSTDIWAAGWSLYHWDGASWTWYENPSGKYINSIDMLSTADGFAAGYSGAILRWNGTAWASITSPTTQLLYGVSLSSPSYGWIVGDRGTALRWDGSAWASVPGAFNSIASTYAVTVLSPTLAWAVGFSNGAHAVYRWDGSSWQMIASLDYFLTAVATTPGAVGTDLWVGGAATLLARYDGAAWTKWRPALLTGLNDLKFASPALGLAAGSDITIGGGSMQWAGGAWAYAGPVDAFALDFVPGSSGRDAWAVGPFGRASRWNGSAWSQVSVPTQSNLNDVDMLSATDGWAVGGGYINPSVILRWQNSAWSEVANPATAYLNGVEMLSASDGFAVGNAGTIIRWNGAAWASVPSPVTVDLAAVEMLSPTDGWAVGDAGTLLHWDGVSWSSAASPTSSDLTAVTMLYPGEGWLGSRDGRLFRRSSDGAGGFMWLAVDSPVTSSINAIAYSSYSHAWAVTAGGLILHFQEKEPALAANFHEGAPGSVFSLTGDSLPPGVPLALIVNNHPLGTVMPGADGSITFELSTPPGEDGFYDVQILLPPGDPLRLALRAQAGLPVRPSQGATSSFAIPAGSAFTSKLTLPLLTR